MSETKSSLLPPTVVAYLTGEIPYSMELQCFWMAVQGCMRVREGANRDRKMHWFHSFCLSVVVGYGGGLFTPLWMGRPTAMLSNDVCLGSCILAYLIVNCTPFDIGYKLCSTFPLVVITTLFAELFRVCGIVNFTNAAYDAFKEKPSAYYPIPIFGPIGYATILGNMGPLFVNGFHAYLANGMPWNFQKGLFCSTFYHFYSHDANGVIGMHLRQFINTYLPNIKLGLDDRLFPIVFISLFMHIMAVLQLPQFLGPSFSPFTVVSFSGSISNAAPSLTKTTAVANKKPADKKPQPEVVKQAPTPEKPKQNKQVIFNREASTDAQKKKKKKKTGGSKKED